VNRFRKQTHKFLCSGGIAAIVIGAVLLAFSTLSVAQYEDYEGAAWCGTSGCHEVNYNQWRTSGHPYKLMRAEEAINRPIPTPLGVPWDDITYVIGGYKWKSRYIDDQGYIITKTLTEDGAPVDGQNQYNYLTGQWSDYHAGEVDKPYDCGGCHTTGWIFDDDAATDGDLSDNQDGLPGMHGTFFAGGVQCEECHGPGFEMDIDQSPDGAAFCGRCHIRGESNTIPASSGFIRHHEQYNEALAGPHATMDCTTCHDPHLRGEFSIKDTAECGVSCHANKMESFSQTSMYDYGVECKDCHMPYATKSAQALGPHQGDLQTHIFYIDTDPTANMFSEDGLFVNLDANGKAKVTMDFACQRCHETAELTELAKFAVDFHDANKSLDLIGLNPGLTGTWWNSARSGEGFLLEVGYANGGLFFFASFYTYDSLGNQVYLFAQGSIGTGTSVEVSVWITEGRMWGAAFDPADGSTDPWGMATFTFPTCESGSIALVPNQAALDMGYTNLAYDITRDLVDSGITCPTFVNDAP
jgi:hypothetical protein